MKEFAVIVSIHLKPGNEAEFLGLLMPVIDAVRLESTFINNFLHQDPEDPTRFMVYENWADQDEFFDVQMKRDYRKPYESRLPELLAEPRQVELWRPLRSDFADQRAPVVKPLVIFTLIGCGTVLGQSPARRELDPAVAARDAAMNKRLDAVIDRAVKEERIVGISMLVAHNGKGVYRRAAGWTDREAKKKMRGNDLFRLASMSKLIVWVAALALVDEGKLGLDDAVTKYLSDFRPQLADGRAPKITVRQLLTHTAGLNYGFLEKSDGPYHRLKVSDGLDDIGITLEENLRRIAAAPLLFEPGTSWNYSVATDVLGAVVAKAGGATLPEVVRRKVTQPLNMNDTAFLAREPSRLAVPYGDGNAHPVRMPDPFALTFGGSQVVYSPRRATDATAFASGGAGMVGAIDDYFRLLEALRKGGAPVLKPETARLITVNAIGDIAVSIAGEGWGWGWSLGLSVLKDPTAAQTPQGVGTWQWSGSYGHSYFVDLKEQLTVIWLTNTAFAGMTGDFPKALVGAVYGK